MISARWEASCETGHLGTGALRGRVPLAPTAQISCMDIGNHVPIVADHRGYGINVVELALHAVSVEHSCTVDCAVARRIRVRAFNVVARPKEHLQACRAARLEVFGIVLEYLTGPVIVEPFPPQITEHHKKSNRAS